MSLLFKLFFKITRLVNESNNLSLIKSGFYLSSKKIQKIWFYVDEKKYNICKEETHQVIQNKIWYDFLILLSSMTF